MRNDLCFCYSHMAKTGFLMMWLIYLLDNIYIRFGTKLYRQIVGIPMGSNCAPLVADFLFCFERDFMTSRFLILSKLRLLKQLNQHQDIWTTF